jgi:hypothetical protein
MLKIKIILIALLACMMFAFAEVKAQELTTDPATTTTETITTTEYDPIDDFADAVATNDVERAKTLIMGFFVAIGGSGLVASLVGLLLKRLKLLAEKKLLEAENANKISKEQADKARVALDAMQVQAIQKVDDLQDRIKSLEVVNSDVVAGFSTTVAKIENLLGAIGALLEGEFEDEDAGGELADES